MQKSVYFYDNEDNISIEVVLNERISILDRKYLQAIDKINQEHKEAYNLLKNELKCKDIKLNHLIEYINLPWYKKLFKKFNDYE